MLFIDIKVMRYFVIQSQSKHKAIFVVGPTAAGKSDLALDLAIKFGGSIINIDSVQFYKGLEIGSAAPSVEDLKKAPHYLYSYLQAPIEQTAGRYLRDFYKLIENHNLKSPLFIVGGTGFYVQALEKGMYDLPEVSVEIKQAILDEYADGHAHKLYQELKDFDPQCELHFNDHYRVGRALEIKRAFNLKISEFKKKQEDLNKSKFPFPYIKVGQTFNADQKELFISRVEQRTQKMLDLGIVDEVDHFLRQGYKDWSPLSSVGLNEVKQYLLGELPEQNLKSMIVQSTMQLVKKQKTWFKRDKSILWSDVFYTDKSKIYRRVQDFLESDV